jgi:signal transduction histidine kinase
MWLTKQARIGLFICLFALGGAINVQASDLIIPLEGYHKFSPGDNTGWSAPEFDDSYWQLQQVPASWRSLGIQSSTGWYRIRFRVTDDLRGIQPAVLLGLIGNADEVFFNGEKIGGEGVVGSQYVQSHVERLYRIPERLIRYGEMNLLAVRVMNVYSGGGIIDGPVLIGDYSSLLVGKLNREKYVTAMESGFFAFFMLAFIFPLFVYSLGSSNRESFYAWLCLLLCAADLILDSRIYYGLGARTFFTERIIAAISCWLPASFLMFLVHWFQQKLSMFARAIAGALVFLGLVALVSPGFNWLSTLSYLVIPVYIATGCLALYITLKAFHRKMRESTILLVGIVGLIAGLVIEMAELKNPPRVYGIFISYYAIAWLAIITTYARAARFVRIQKSLRSISERILMAHEDERKRLARDLHDGVGQSMMALKLNLQMMNARTGSGQALKDWLSSMISEVSASIEELRRVASSLRPSFLEDVDIADAFDWYGRQFQERTGANVQVEITDTIHANTRTKDHIFRIYQEALNNIGKHAQAKNVLVTLKAEGPLLRLEIKDDGKGFDVTDATNRDEGMGLSNVRERAELLGGTFQLKSSMGVGTSIRVEVPLDD